MAIRQAIASKLAEASKAVANDRFKEKAAAAVLDGRRKLAQWISPDKIQGVYVQRAVVRVLG